ncbi:MAG: prefoldin subunit [Candidatus Micrarchaeaceae archaeon]
MENKNPNEEIEKLARDYQIIQEQLRNTKLQIEQLQIQQTELGIAENEVKNATGKIYRTVGGVIVESDKDSSLKDIAEKKETTGLRIQRLNKQLEELNKREAELRNKILQLQKGGSV